MEINTRIVGLNWIDIEVGLDSTKVDLGMHDLDQAHLILAELKDSVENLQECIIKLERNAQ
jgi:hypothetical protein